jgi:hypothetical protein
MKSRKRDRYDILTAESNLNNTPLYYPQFGRTFHRPWSRVRLSETGKKSVRMVNEECIRILLPCTIRKSGNRILTIS